MKFKKIKVFYRLILSSLSNNNNAIQRMASILKENVPSSPAATGIICNNHHSDDRSIMETFKNNILGSKI